MNMLKDVFNNKMLKKNNVEESKPNQKKLSRGRTLNIDTTTSPSLVGLSDEYDC